MTAVQADRIALSLVSHTNAGKTTLARTLLGRDVGEVRDAAHVTEVAERYPMIELPDGATLELWDTPGFGDSVRLARRLERQGSPIGWFLSEVWDRFRDRPLWSTQQAVKNVRDESDVVLYLVNAAENPEDAGYLAPEMRVLELIGKPVLVLLNQLGAPRPVAEEASMIEGWTQHLRGLAHVRGVLALDAFARCWVQEITLLDAIARVLPDARQSLFGEFRRAWAARREATFALSMDTLAARLARAALDRAEVPEDRLRDQLRDVARVLGVGKGGAPTARQAAMAELAARLEADIQAGNDALIRAHELAGTAREEVLLRLNENYTVSEPVSEGRAALLGGAITGALVGLKADLASGGLTLGGGLLTGGLVGALGAAGLARGVNLVRGTERTTLEWSAEMLAGILEAGLLTYLAVAHYGRGRGNWLEGERPAHWQPLVHDVLETMQPPLGATLAARGSEPDAAFGAAVRRLVEVAARAVLLRLYPDADEMLAGQPISARKRS